MLQIQTAMRASRWTFKSRSPRDRENRSPQFSVTSNTAWKLQPSLAQCCEEAAVQVQMLLWQEYGKCKIELGSTFVRCDEIGCDISLERGLCTNFWTNFDENDQKTLQTAAVFDLDIFHRLLNEQKGCREVRNCHQLLIVLLAHLFFFSPSRSADQLWLWLDVPTVLFYVCISALMLQHVLPFINTGHSCSHYHWFMPRS